MFFLTIQLMYKDTNVQRVSASINSLKSVYVPMYEYTQRYKDIRVGVHPNRHQIHITSLKLKTYFLVETQVDQ
jgi:hypothetical protein